MAAAVISAALAAGCISGLDDEWAAFEESWTAGGGENNPGLRVEKKDMRKVLLLYSAGNNNIAGALLSDISDLMTGYLPGGGNADDKLLVYTHSYSSPYLIRLYRTSSGITVADTLITYPEETVSASAEQLNNVLSYIKEEFDAVSYGMIFSSHGTGYVPSGFYSSPDKYVFQEADGRRERKGRKAPSPVPYIEVEHDPSLPRVKSIGQDAVGSLSYEIDIRDFADAIPMKMDYILFDSCFMGGIEVAYELKDKCDRLGFSQAEILEEGFNYRTLTQHLLQKEEPDPRSVCDDYYIQYDQQSGAYRSATISLVDCRRLEPLAEFCKSFFESRRDALADIRYSRVQRFYRGNSHWFYDLESIIVEAGATEEELAELHDILNGCVLYKGHTPNFLASFRIHTFSGFSMYLPCHGHSELDKYYRTLDWNQAAGLIKF